VSDSPFQIFISYARDDDAVPPGVLNATGFVTFLHGQLEFAFKKRGPRRPSVWRDLIGIEKADQFEQRIETEITKSSVLLIVLSHNWMSRPFCRRELECFARRWRSEGELGTRRRIIVVGKRHVDFEHRPSLLQGQEGFSFYALDDPDKFGSVHEFFGPEGPRDARYWKRIEELADYLMRFAGFDEARRPAQAAAPAPAWNGRTIYVAKPATDMRKAYDRLVKELEQREFRVVPDPAADIPYHGGARDMIDAALEQSEVSIHLLGEKHGPTPEDAQPLVDLQLAHAAARVSAGATGDARLRRIVWAPANLDPELGLGDSITGRDPLAVLGKFSEHLPTDKVHGDGLSKFVDFLFQNLERTVPDSAPAPQPADANGDARYYVHYWPKDRRFAVSVAKALLHRNVVPILAAVDGDEVERNALHRQRLQECDAIVLCWGAASETWAITSASELRSWRDLGRSKKFACRGLVVGPPPHEVKADIVELPPRSEIDVILDLTAHEQPTPEALGPLFATPGP
jgi:hypothetical protein